MNQFFSYSFIALPVCAGIRWLVAKVTGVDALDIRTLVEWELWVYGAGAALTALSIWHNFIRKSCSKCGSYSIRYKGHEEYNQVHREKKVQEKDNNGRTVTRHLTVTYAQLRHYHACNNCTHQWTTLSERPK